jgi:hypothetical protein
LIAAALDLLSFDLDLALLDIGTEKLPIRIMCAVVLVYDITCKWLPTHVRTRDMDVDQSWLRAVDAHLLDGLHFDHLLPLPGVVRATSLLLVLLHVWRLLSEKRVFLNVRYRR